MEEFSKATYDVFGKVYQQANPQGGADAQNGGTHVNDDGSVDSEFTDNK